MLLILCLSANAAQVALTIDDLPYLGKAIGDPGKIRRENNRFKIILNTLIEQHIPATGFVVTDSIEPGQWELLNEFHQAGNIIGNHTHDHIKLKTTNGEEFIKSIDRADKILAPLLSHPKYFRFPYLTRSKSCKTNLLVKEYLTKNNYVIAPVTIDAKDFYLNQQLHAIPWRRRKKMLPAFRHRYMDLINHQIDKAERKAMKQAHRPIKQILLIHMNTLNAHFLSDIIKLFRKRGYEFISLPDALQDPYYDTSRNTCKIDLAPPSHIATAQKQTALQKY